jgi:hypothetical protein
MDPSIVLFVRVLLQKFNQIQTLLSFRHVELHVIAQNQYIAAREEPFMGRASTKENRSFRALFRRNWNNFD